MRIVLLTPGTGSYYCGVCMRDNALAKELIRQGHDAVMLPMYLPLVLDEDAARGRGEVFYGGINVYLQQKLAFFRHAPRWVDDLLNHPLLLRLAGRFGGMTGGALVGELTHSMLLGEEGRQARELQKLTEWMREHGRPDAVWLSTALLAGLAKPLKEALGVPVLCSLQGEDEFLDHLAPPWRERCWETLAVRSAAVDLFVAPSRYFGELMGRRLRLAEGQVAVVPNAIALRDFEGPEPSGPAVPTIGYLARMIADKGLGILVDAFILLKKRGRFPKARLRCAGAMTAGDEVYVAELQARLAAAGVADEVDFLPNISREEKVAFLRSLNVFSVPATYSEAFGLYLLEALAAGVPVVQPRHAAFPEVVEATGGGVLCDVGSAESLADGIEKMLGDPVAARAMGRAGRDAVFARYGMGNLAGAFLGLTSERIDAGAVRD